MAILRKLIAAIKKKFFKPKRKRRSKLTLQRHRRRSPRFPKKKNLVLSKRPRRKTKKTFAKKQKSLKKTFKKSPKAVLKRISAKEDQGTFVGEVTHYFSKIKVCVIRVDRGPVAIGDKLNIKGKARHLKQAVRSLQIENSDVRIAPQGALVGLKVDKKVRPGDKVFKL